MLKLLWRIVQTRSRASGWDLRQLGRAEPGSGSIAHDGWGLGIYVIRMSGAGPRCGCDYKRARLPCLLQTITTSNLTLLPPITPSQSTHHNHNGLPTL
jgi:hypothetical protein